MPFTDRFQLLDLKRDEGARTFEAREIATGRPVYVHLFADPSAPLNRALLAKLEALPEEERHRIIDHGDHEGGLYLVTDRLAEYPGLREWLKAKNENQPRPLDARGAWQFKPPAPDPPPFDTAPLPVIEPSPIPEPVISKLTNSGEQTLQMPAPAEQPPPPSPEPGEFTRQFALPVPPKIIDPAGEPTVEMLAPIVPPTPPPPPKSPAAIPPNEPGEFTRLFAAPPVLRPTPPPAAPPNEPGEFTRQFAPPPVLRPTPTPPTAPLNEPGEFTRQFAPPLVLRPTPPPPAAPPNEPGEFTRLFPSTPSKPAAPTKPAPPPGEFTRQFQAPQRPISPAPRVPPPSPTPPQAGQPGEFTQMLQAQRPVSPKPPANQSSQTGEFTRYFESPMTPQGSQPHSAPLAPPRPPSHPKDAGEFTQIFGRGDMPSPPPPQAPAAPPNPSSANATQVFATPRPVNTMPMASPGNMPNTPYPVPQKPQAPGEYTQMFAAPASLTFGQAPSGPPNPRMADPVPVRRNTSRLPLLLVVGAVVLLIFAVVVYIIMRPHGS